MTEVLKHEISSEENSAIRSALRRRFSRTEIVRTVLSDHLRYVPRYKKDGERHKVDQKQHLCGVCEVWVPATVVSVDHILPVIDVEEGFIDWNTYVARLFCGKDNLQIICDTCHQAKTNAERDARNLIKYEYFLNNIEMKILDMERDIVVRNKNRATMPSLKKELAKYRAKKKPDSVKKRANELNHRLIMLMEIL